jgi:hypothetical protein
MNTSAVRCDRIIALIDACLADIEGASKAQLGYSPQIFPGSRRTSSTRDRDSQLSSRKGDSNEPVFD